MIEQMVLVIHIAVLGYWLGSELVINSTFRYVSWSGFMPFAERNRLMNHVMDVDQHVRYALVLQLGLGTALAAIYGLIPGGNAVVSLAVILSIAWLVLVEVTHRWRSQTFGIKLAAIDRVIRYIVILALLVIALFTSSGSYWVLPEWLRWKLVCFAGVVACGLGIRFALISFYRTWIEIERDGSNAVREQSIRQAYKRATAVLIVLWVLILIIFMLSVRKPA